MKKKKYDKLMWERKQGKKAIQNKIQKHNSRLKNSI